MNESVGIAAGFLISAIHQAGLVAVHSFSREAGVRTETAERADNALRNNVVRRRVWTRGVRRVGEQG